MRKKNTDISIEELDPSDDLHRWENSGVELNRTPMTGKNERGLREEIGIDVLVGG